MNDIQREDPISNIRNFLNSGHIKSLKEIDDFLLKELSSYEIQYIDYFQNWYTQWSIKNFDNYSKYQVRIYIFLKKIYVLFVPNLMLMIFQ